MLSKVQLPHSFRSASVFTRSTSPAGREGWTFDKRRELWSPDDKCHSLVLARGASLGWARGSVWRWTRVLQALSFPSPSSHFNDCRPWLARLSPLGKSPSFAGRLLVSGYLISSKITGVVTNESEKKKANVIKDAKLRDESRVGTDLD